MYPPINLAIENDGELRNPTANAIPEGRRVTSLDEAMDAGKDERKALTNERHAKRAPKPNIKGMT